MPRALDVFLLSRCGKTNGCTCGDGKADHGKTSIVLRLSTEIDFEINQRVREFDKTSATKVQVHKKLFKIN